jgi:hypothetical protein
MRPQVFLANNHPSIIKFQSVIEPQGFLNFAIWSFVEGTYDSSWDGTRDLDWQYPMILSQSKLWIFPAATLSYGDDFSYGQQNIVKIDLTQYDVHWRRIRWFFACFYDNKDTIDFDITNDSQFLNVPSNDGRYLADVLTKILIELNVTNGDYKPIGDFVIAEDILESLKNKD